MMLLSPNREPKRPSLASIMKFVVICTVVVVAGYFVYRLAFPTYSLRYRLTLVFEVDGVEHAGSGVVEISIQPAPDWLVSGLEGSHFGGKLHGYAITVDLGNRGLLFVLNSIPLLHGPNGLLFPGAATLGSLPLVAYGFPETGLPSHMMRIVRQIQDKTGSVDVPIDKLPMILRFRDINDPNSNEELDLRNLDAVYGPGARLKRAILQLTHDRITPMPRTWPKWLVNYNSGIGFRLHAYKGSVFRSARIPADRFKGD